ncbi:MAG TPA: DUF2911 domain-containing protein [Longimicrobium sp.]|jgi:hypothetical protein
MSLHPKQMRTRALAALLALTALTAPAAAQQGGQPLSPRDTARLEIAAGKRVYVDYGRPSMRGRRIVGELVPYGRVWRTGANAATTLVTETDLRIGDALVPRGTYTLYTLPTAQGWTLIINRQTGQWGTQYEASRDLVRIPMRTTRLAQPVEKFTIALERGSARGTGTLAMAWENTRLTVPVRVQAAAAPRRR